MKPLKSGYRVSIESAGEEPALSVRDSKHLEYALAEALIGHKHDVVAYRTCLQSLAVIYESLEGDLSDDETEIGNAVALYAMRIEAEKAAKRAAW
jgi:hypothetical protein